MASSLPTAVATALVRRGCSTMALARHGSRRCVGSASAVRLFAPTAKNDGRRKTNPFPCQFNAIHRRSLSSMPPPPVASPPTTDVPYQEPTALSPEAGLGAQDAMRLFIEHGLGKQKLSAIASTKSDGTPLVERWQKMIATYLETQCHVIALLGYKPDERGIALYTQHLSSALQLSPPDVQESLRASSRDTYRMVLAGAFGMPDLLEETKSKGELSVVDARNLMHKVSLRMQDPEVLEEVAKRCSEPVAMNDSREAREIELARKHTVVQEVMVSDVYLSEGEGRISLVSESGFGEGEDGYVRLQSALAEHQGDPLINQYVGAAMMKLIQSAGIDMEALQRGQVGPA